MVFKKSLQLLIVMAVLTAFSCSESPSVIESSEQAGLSLYGDSSGKMNGVSFVAPSRPIKGDNMNSVVDLGANWVTLMPYGYGKGSGSDEGNRLHWNVEWQWWGEKSKGLRECIQFAHERNLKVMVKPQIWFRHGSFTGDFILNDAKDWKTFEDSYEEFILTFAKVAEEEKAASFCIGTEWKKFVAERPDFWHQLIPKVRAVFSGELTYAANWDCYHLMPFWKELDYIGIDAYFPLSDAKSPTEGDLMRGWDKHFENIKKLSESTGKPVVFTEFGYRSMDYNANEPWDSGKKSGVNLSAQTTAYQAIFKKFWNQPWFKGGFLWKWYDYHTKAGGKQNNAFTPQNKPVQKLIEEWYKKQ